MTDKNRDVDAAPSPHRISVADIRRGGGKRPPRSPVNLRSYRRLAIVLAVLALLVILIPFPCRRLTDLLWYREIGFERVFFLKVVAQWALGLVVGLGALAVFAGNARLALRGFGPDHAVLTGAPGSFADMRARLLGQVSLVTWPASILFAVVIALAAA